MDAEELTATRRAQEAESARRLENAKKPPRQSTGAGGFQSNAPDSGSALAAPAPGETDGGLSGGVIHSAEQEENIRQKAASGGVITNDDIGGAHDYLGHFARDGVLTKGHNVGMKAKGKAPLVKLLATRGFRKLAGSAAPLAGHAQYGEAHTGLRPPRHEREAMAKAKASATRALKKFPVMMHDPIPLGDTPPRAVSDVSLSRRHHLEAAARDLRHMKDHEASRKKHLAEAKVRGKQLGR